MGSFANTLFMLLFGWVQPLVAGIWGALTGGSGESFLTFIGKNWIVIVLGLCIAGLVIDFGVYLTRWRPYRVWASFFRKLKRSRLEADDTVSAVSPVEPSYNWGRQEPQEADVEMEEYPEEAEDLQVPPYAAYSGVEPFRTAEEIREAPVSSRERMERAIQPRRRRASFSRLLSDEQDDYVEAPQNLIDRHEAYRKPVYPKKWKSEDEAGE